MYVQQQENWYLIFVKAYKLSLLAAGKHWECVGDHNEKDKNGRLISFHDFYSYVVQYHLTMCIIIFMQSFLIFKHDMVANQQGRLDKEESSNIKLSEGNLKSWVENQVVCNWKHLAKNKILKLSSLSI